MRLSKKVSKTALMVNKILLILAIFSAMFWLCCLDAVSIVPAVLLVFSLLWAIVELLIIAYLFEKIERQLETEKYVALEKDRIKSFNSGAKAAEDYI